RYGSPRVREPLRRDYGKRVCRKKVAVAASLPLMREHGLNVRGRRKFIPRTTSNHGFPVGENLLNRRFHAEAGGQKWVSDITYLRTSGGWVYLTVVPE
ncbi:MAG: IS3 family transposase, partial [Treponema sp.]|nr:IS3 family transposase [Treponema sp.]